jgi:5-methylcytosine-specific restriction endonuclease McrA
MRYRNHNSRVTIIRRAVRAPRADLPHAPSLLPWQVYSTFNYPPQWTPTLRRRIRRRDKGLCRVCQTPRPLAETNIHHINYDKRDCSPINLITLCEPCHHSTNTQRHNWYRYLYNLMSDTYPAARSPSEGVAAA